MRTNVKCNTRFPWNNVILKIWRRIWHDVGHFKGWPLETRNLAASQCDSHYQRLIGLQVWKKIEACTCTKRAFDFHTDTRMHTGVLVTALFTILSLSLSLFFFLHSSYFSPVHPVSCSIFFPCRGLTDVCDCINGSNLARKCKTCLRFHAIMAPTIVVRTRWTLDGDFEEINWSFFFLLPG